MKSRPNTTPAPGFRMALANAPENVAIVRQALAGAAGAVGLGQAGLLDVNAAVSEACNNVVVHAYPDAAGPMWVRFRVGPGELEVTVADEGVGIRPHPPAPELQLEGLGMSLIQTLTDRVELLGGAGEGTEVQMAFGFDAGPERSGTVTPSSAHPEIDPPPGELSIAVSAGPLAAPVLGRVIAMLAARAGFSLEGISDAQLVTDSLAARLPGVSPGGEIRLGVDLPARELLIRAGPLNEGAGELLLAGSPSDGLPPVLERLTRGRRVERDDRGETLRLDLVSPR